MGIYNNALSGASGNQGYNLQRSLRFRSSASAYLTRTMSASGTTATFSFWVKRGKLGVLQSIFDWTNGVDTSYGIQFTAADTIQFYSYLNVFVAELVTTQVFRDPSAWYHIVAVQDTTNATSTDRFRLYVNGSRITAFSTTVYPAQNTSLVIGTARAFDIGAIGTSNTQNFDGYLAEFNFIDGQALTPSSFGSTNPVTGVWQPAKYTGTYGTNGFYLPFTDNSALTSGSNAGLGKDFSGNGNYWNTNNISITSGSTYDSMTDVPTLTSATAANYCVLNPLAKASNQTISDGNLTLVDSASNSKLLGTLGVDSGKWYWEITPYSGSLQMIGVALTTSPINQYPGQDANSWSWYQGNGGVKINNGTQTSYATYTNNDVIGIALDLSAGTLTFYKNGTSQGIAFSSLPSGTYTPSLGYNGSMYANFGQRPFAYTPPTGFVALNTYNLPTSTIVKGNTVMDATLYTGNGTSQTITNSGMQPDLVWTKSRSNAYDHALVDSNRGAARGLASNLTAAEDGPAGNYVTAFNSNGFNLGGGTGSNGNGATYVGWQWQAGKGSNVTNTSGSITSTVSVNPTAGFSIVTYTGTGANATVGHGLGVAPAMVIIKNRSITQNWITGHKSLWASSANNLLLLNSNGATINNSQIWNGSAPTSSVFSVGVDTGVSGNANSIVAYCFSEVAGYSKFGSYTGNGSTDGPFVYLGFRPKYIMVKRTDSLGDWVIWDSARNTYNALGNVLYPNLSNAEATGSGMNFMSNGFKFYNDTGTSVNASGGTYIFMAFAENPFKNALAR